MAYTAKGRHAYWVCVIGNQPEAVRIGEGGSEWEAMKYAFGLDFDEARHVAYKATTRISDIRTDKKRRAYIEEAVRRYNELVSKAKEPKYYQLVLIVRDSPHPNEEPWTLEELTHHVVSRPWSGLPAGVDIIKTHCIEVSKNAVVGIDLLLGRERRK